MCYAGGTAVQMAEGEGFVVKLKCTFIWARGYPPSSPSFSYQNIIATFSSEVTYDEQS